MFSTSTDAKSTHKQAHITNKQEGDAEAGKLTKKETMEKGAVAWGVVKKYIAAGNIVMFAAIVFSFLNRLVARVWYSWSLSQWTNDAEEAELWGLSQSSSQSSLFPTSSERNERVAEVNNHYVVVQGLLLLYETAAYVIVGVLWMFFGRRASAKIQKGFINLIAFAKATFYDTFVPTTKHPPNGTSTKTPLTRLWTRNNNRTPLGRLISRFSKDFVCHTQPHEPTTIETNTTRGLYGCSWRTEDDRPEPAAAHAVHDEPDNDVHLCCDCGVARRLVDDGAHGSSWFATSTHQHTHHTPYHDLVYLPTVIIYFVRQRRYRRTVIQARRMEGVTRSPIYVHYDNTLTGLMCIRAYKCVPRFEEEFRASIDENARTFQSIFLLTQWYAERLDWLGSFTQGVTVASLMAGKYLTALDIGLASLAVSNMAQITQALSGVSRNVAEVEQSLQAVERIDEFSGVEPEEDPTVPKCEVGDEWPQSGAISFDHVTARYRPFVTTTTNNTSTYFLNQHQATTPQNEQRTAAGAEGPDVQHPIGREDRRGGPHGLGQVDAAAGAVPHDQRGVRHHHHRRRGHKRAPARKAALQAGHHPSGPNALQRFVELSTTTTDNNNSNHEQQQHALTQER